MIVLGLLLGMVGQDIYTGTPRFTFGFFELYSGINFVSVAVGVFGVAEILRNLENETTRDVMVKQVSNLWLTREQFRRIAAPGAARHRARLGPRRPARRRPRALLLRLLLDREAALEAPARSSATAPSRASPARRAPTTPPPRPRSSRC